MDILAHADIVMKNAIVKNQLHLACDSPEISLIWSNSTI